MCKKTMEYNFKKAVNNTEKLFWSEITNYENFIPTNERKRLFKIIWTIRTQHFRGITQLLDWRNSIPTTQILGLLNFQAMQIIDPTVVAYGKDKMVKVILSFDYKTFGLHPFLYCNSNSNDSKLSMGRDSRLLALNSIFCFFHVICNIHDISTENAFVTEKSIPCFIKTRPITLQYTHTHKSIVYWYFRISGKQSNYKARLDCVYIAFVVRIGTI